jgi:hypothetical protein
MGQGMGALIARLGLAAEDHPHLAGRGEVDDHVRSLVGGPDVAVRRNADGVGEGPSVEVLADLSQEAPLRIELQQLGGRRAVGRADGVAALEDEDVALAVDGHSRYFAQVHVGRGLQGVGGVEGNWAWRGGERTAGDPERPKDGGGELHGVPPDRERNIRSRLRPSAISIARVPQASYVLVIDQGDSRCPT